MLFPGFDLPERFQMPGAIGHGGFPAEDVEVTIAGADFVKDVRRAIPLIDYFFDDVAVPLKSEANRPFVALPPGIAIDLQFHAGLISALRTAQAQ